MQIGVISKTVNRHLIMNWATALDVKIWSDPFQLSVLSPHPKTIIPHALVQMSSRASGSLTSVLMDITFPFLHLCTQSVLAWGKVSHQYVLQLHSSQPQIGKIINTAAQWSPLCLNQFNHVAMTGNVCCHVMLAVYGFVCFSTFRAAKQASNWGLSVCSQRKLENSHILVKRDWDRENESLARIDFSILKNKLEPHTLTYAYTHTHIQTLPTGL